MVTIDLAGTTHLKVACPMLVMFGVPCPVDNTAVEQVNTLRASGLACFRVVKFAPTRPVFDGFVLGVTTPEEVCQQAYENCTVCEDVKHGYSCLRCRGVKANKLGLVGPPVSELWLGPGPDGRLIDVDVYRWGISTNDTAATRDGARHALRDVLDMPTSTMGDASPVILGASPLQIAHLQWQSSDCVAVVTASNPPYVGLVVREQYMSSRP